MKGYETDASDHLQRAVTLLLKGGLDNLLYAGLEIRLGTEARQNLYASSWDEIPKKYRKSYKITEVGKALDRAFKLGIRAALVTIHFDDGSAPVAVHYTPVSPQLRDACSDLGNYLHAVKWQDVDAETEEQWVSRLRFLVITGVIHLHFATQGKLLGPAMSNAKQGSRQITVRVLLAKDHPSYARLMEVGRNLKVEVAYRPIDEFVAPLLNAFEDIEVLRQLLHPGSANSTPPDAVPIVDGT